MSKKREVYTIRQFCRMTGWPYEEFSKLRIRPLKDILALYDLSLSVRIKATGEVIDL